MLRTVTYRFATTIALISGAPKYDALTSTILNSLKAASPDLQFVGATGKIWRSEFTRVYGSSGRLDNYEFLVTRPYTGYDQQIQDSVGLPYRTWTHLRNMEFIHHLKGKKFFDDLVQKNASAVITVGNFSLAKRVGKQLNKFYGKANKVRPYTALFDYSIWPRIVENEEFFDFQYHWLGKPADNFAGYTFPSLCVGYEGLFAAFQYLQKFKKDPTNDSFAHEHFSLEVSQLVEKARAEFRTARGISQDRYVISFYAGHFQKGADFSIHSLLKSLKEFTEEDKIKGLAKEYFDLFVVLPKDEKLGQHVKSKLTGIPDKFKVTIVEYKDRYGAFCASDFAVLHNGEITVQAAACQLPAIVLDSMSNFHAYFTYLYNGHASPLNVSTNFHGYEDICGSLSATKQKIAFSILNHFERPKLRYHYVKLYRDQIQRMLSKSGTNPELRVSETGYATAAKHILSKVEAYNKLDASVPLRQRLRKEALQIQ